MDDFDKRIRILENNSRPNNGGGMFPNLERKNTEDNSYDDKETKSFIHREEFTKKITVITKKIKEYDGR